MIKIAFSPIYSHNLPENHRFPMLKYELIPKQLIREGICTEENLFLPSSCDEDVVLLTHDAVYIKKLMNQQLSFTEIRKIGFPLSVELIKREFIITQGTIDAALFALKFGISLNVAGGTHHAFADRGEGFCLINDIAVASNYLLKNKLRSKILIVDLDVHQGNGTAKLMENNKNVFTFSMHGGNNYPFHKEKSDLDIELKNGTTGLTYLSILHDNLPKLMQNFEPDFVFYLAGVDILETDKLGKLSVNLHDCKKRDNYVLSLMKENSIPTVVVLGGGYSPEIKTIVDAHCNTFRAAFDNFD